MSTSAIAFIIILLTLVLYSTGKMPVALVSVLSLVFMVLTGVIPFAEAFKGFSSGTVFTIVGMMFIGQSLFENGVAEKIGRIAFGGKRTGEGFVVVRAFFLTAMLSAFLYNTAVIVMMMPIVAAYVEKAHGNLKEKNFFMALSHATILGSRLTIIGSDGFFIAHEVMDSSSVNYKFGFFEPFPIMFVTIIIMTLAYYYIIYPLGKRVFTDVVSSATESMKSQDISYNKRNAIISIAVMVTVILSAAFMKKGQAVIPELNLGLISMMGAAILFLTGCIRFEEQLKKLNWDALIIVGASYGFASCFLKTGVGDLLVKLILSAGGMINYPVFLVFLFSIGSALITNLMANAAAVTILTSLAISISTGLGVNAVPLIMAVVCGSASGLMLPTSTSTLTVSMVAGYRYTDYILIGGVVTIITTVVETLMISAMYGLL